jgi:pimeloyl-[acyl-carrier protein] methyl ester esterase
MTTLVLLPGMDGTGELFAPFTAALGRRARAHVISYPPHEPLEYPALEKIVRAELPADEDYVMLAESFSGPLAISIAAAHPRHLKGLVLCATFASNPRPLAAPLRLMLNRLPLNAIPAHLSTPVLLGHFATDELTDALRRTLAPVSSAVLRARLHAVLAVDMSAKMEKVKVPVLYLRATHDRVVPHSASTHIALLCPQTKFVEIDAPHFLLQAKPKEGADLVAEFVREVTHKP